MSQTALEVKNIKKSFGSVEVLRNISFDLDFGEVLVILGSSGSGKTTLLRCLNFLETADEGEISVFGKLIWKAGIGMSEAEIRRNRLRFGLVFQSFNLFSQYNVLDNVTLAPMLLETERLRAECKADKKRSFVAEKKALEAKITQNAHDLLRNVGLGEKEKSYPCELSGGQSQRAAIARALAMSPDILCFDEPTSALDPELTGEVLRVIRALRDNGRTMIIVTHEMDFARAVADKIIFMSNGVISVSGTPDEVFNDEKVRSFVSGIGEM